MAAWSEKGLCVVREAWLTPFTATLTDLILSNNYLSTLPAIIPWGMPNLRFLVITNCGLEIFPEPGVSSLCTKLVLHVVVKYGYYA